MPIAAASVIPAARLRECLIALPFLRRPVPCWTTPERLYSRHDAADIPDGSDDGSGGGDLDYRAEAGGGPRHPRPGDRAGLPPAGWAGAAGGGAGAARGDAGPRLPAPGSGLSRPVAGRAAALRRREALGCRLDAPGGEWPPARRAARRRDPGVAPLRSLLRDLRPRPLPRHRAAPPPSRVAGPPLPAGTELVWRQAMLDVLLEYPIVSERSSFAIDPAFARLGLRTATVLRFLPPGRAERAF